MIVDDGLICETGGNVAVEDCCWCVTVVVYCLVPGIFIKYLAVLDLQLTARLAASQSRVAMALITSLPTSSP
jgi:uncharacterized membrane protein YjjP (DUF1212 family)